MALPGMKTPLLVGRPRSMAAVEKAWAGGKIIMLASQKSSRQNEPGEDDIRPIGCLAELSRPRKWPDGTLQTTVEGLSRARIISFQDAGEMYMVAVERLEEVSSPAAVPTMRVAKNLLEKLARLKSSIPKEAAPALLAIQSPSIFADLCCENILPSTRDRQVALEILDVKERLEYIVSRIQEEIEVQEIESSVRGRVKKQMEKSQRDYYLTEQMKAIQKELGRGEEEKGELDEYTRKIQAAGMPKETEEKAFKELSRLEQMPPQSAEGTVVRNYLDWLTDVPWRKKTADKINVEEAAKILNEDHHGLEEVKDRIVEFLAVRTLAEEIRGPILCLAGPPGVGKTSLGRSIARAMDRKFVRFSLGGVRDEAEIRGHRRTYIGALPGKIIQGMKRAGVKNPVMMLDEVDKLSSDFRGDPSSALLEALDPEQNKAFNDHFLEVDYDLSEVMFITTANNLSAIPRALRDRMEVISVPGYNDEEKLSIAEGFLVPRQLKQHGLGPREISFNRKALWAIIRNHTREAGVRELERLIAKVCRKVARTVATARQAAAGHKKTAKLILTPVKVPSFLGESRYREEVAEKRAGVGLATALAWTEVGGAILKIETSVLPGKGEFILTGKLGDVMKESAQAALSYIRGRAGEFGLEKGFHSMIDIHIHIPEGATPKDGPSAGVALCVSMISALLKTPARGDVAMTGEITLRGNIIMIGGLREKLLAAGRAGIKTVLIPAENAGELSEAPEAVKRDLTIITVDKMDDALGPAFGPGGLAGRDAPVRPVKRGGADHGRASLN